MRQQPPQTSQILSVHLDEPFLNPHKRGARPQEYLLPLTIELVTQIFGRSADIVKVVTLDPELDRSGEVISHMRYFRHYCQFGALTG